jgi:hypothetical protein
MPVKKNIKQEYEEICGYRRGAHYHKMDLHTHTPASECSSFTLPSAIEAVFPQKPKSVTRKWCNQCFQLLESLAGGMNPFETAYNSGQLVKRPRLAERPQMNLNALMGIANLWLDEIKILYSPGAPKLTKSLKKNRDSFIKNAIGDLRNYLASLFFPEEFIMRCYIEGLQIVAINDHNHPGYIVPRLPTLGTWFSALQAANEPYREDIRNNKKSGENVRTVILERLSLAKDRLIKSFDEKSSISPETKKQHDESKEHKKALAALKKRKEHIRERVNFWKKTENRPLPLTLLPGVEFTVSNVHLLGIFPPKWYVPGRIGSILRTIGITEEQWGRGFVAAASASVQDTITLVDKEGGITIPAHSNSDFKGLLRLFKKGLALTKVLEHEALISLETIGGNIIAGEGKKKAKDTCDTLRWLESGLSRPDRGMPLSFVKGSDAHECRIELDGTGEDLGFRYSFVKMDIRQNDTADEVFRSLRLALMSGQSRVIEIPTEDGYNFTAPKKSCRIDKSERLKLLDCEKLRPTILGMTVSGKDAYTDGLKLSFNPYLNCIVGSGGKSTLVRMLAYAFGARSFMKWTKKSWLPEQVRVFWHQGNKTLCIERTGRNIDPHAANIRARWLELNDKGDWEVMCESPDDKILALANLVDIWPPPEVLDDQEKSARLKRKSENAVIKELIKSLQFDKVEGTRPLLVNQPRDIFNNEKIFKAVLSKPLLKARQIIWSTNSPNVPTALDAEKIVITGEKPKKRRMEIICAGDLHEDEIREQFMNQFEGGWAGFARRNALYSS